MKLSENEEALYAELVVQTAIHMLNFTYHEASKEEIRRRKDRFDIKNCVIEHTFMGHFEAACRVLLDLRAVLPLDSSLLPMDDESSWAAYFRLKFDVPELREHLGQGLPPSAPPLSKVIEAFLGITTDYVPVISARRDEIAVHPGFERTFELLNGCGYVERVGDKVKWTNKIAPHMRATYVWTEDGVSEEEQYEAEIEEIWQTMPPKFRKTFFSSNRVDVISLGVMISRFWYDGKWQDIDRDGGKSETIIRGGATAIAKDLAKKAGEAEG